MRTWEGAGSVRRTALWPSLSSHHEEVVGHVGSSQRPHRPGLGNRTPRHVANARLVFNSCCRRSRRRCRLLRIENLALDLGRPHVALQRRLLKLCRLGLRCGRCGRCLSWRVGPEERPQQRDRKARAAEDLKGRRLREGGAKRNASKVCEGGAKRNAEMRARCAYICASAGAWWRSAGQSEQEQEKGMTATCCQRAAWSR